MRKLTLVLPIALLFALPLLSEGQCNPDPQYTTPGIYPDTATGLPDAIATEPYAFTFTVVVPPDTNIGGFIVPIDSIGIDQFQGLPPGFSYITDSPSDYWKGDSTGCVLIQGMPQQADVGVHPFTVTVIAKAGGITAPYTITGYKIEILDSVYAAVPDPSAESIFAFPNPADEEMNLYIRMDNLPGSQVRLINSLGQTVGRFETESGQDMLTIPTHDYEPGIYTLIYNDDRIRKDLRVMISR